MSNHPLQRFIGASMLFITVFSECRKEGPKTFNGERLQEKSQCLIVDDSLFLNIYASFTSWGGAISFDFPGSVDNRFIASTFISCYTSFLVLDDFGGGAAVSADEIVVERCCGSGCYSEYGQFLHIKGCSVCALSYVSAVECAPPGNANADNGALDFNNNVSPTLRNVNCTSCYCTTNCAALNFWDSSGLPDCQYFTILKCTGSGSVYSERQHLTFSDGNFVSNDHSEAVVCCSLNFITLNRCHFTRNSDPIIRCTDGGRFNVLNCYLSSPLPGDVSYASASGNVFDGNEPTLPICHLGTIHCEKAIDCTTFFFIASAVLVPSSMVALNSLPGLPSSICGRSSEITLNSLPRLLSSIFNQSSEITLNSLPGSPSSIFGQSSEIALNSLPESPSSIFNHSSEITLNSLPGLPSPIFGQSSEIDLISLPGLPSSSFCQSSEIAVHFFPGLPSPIFGQSSRLASPSLPRMPSVRPRSFVQRSSMISWLFQTLCSMFLLQ
jgi:hypothetical protein